MRQGLWIRLVRVLFPFLQGLWSMENSSISNACVIDEDLI